MASSRVTPTLCGRPHRQTVATPSGIEKKMTVHPQSNRPYRELREKPAPVRYSHGTREGRLTVAPFRAWRGLTHPVAWGPTINAIPRGSFDTSGPREGIQPRYSGLRVTGHRYLPI